MIDIKQIDKKLNNYRFVDLFAGIGGFHYALSSFGAECVFASDIDKKASLTYFMNHGIKPFGDITQIDEQDIPGHDIICGGFPCQSFSISGKQKGFDDIRGTLFFDIVRIAKHHKPKILFLENVKNFERHDNGKTIGIVKETLNKIGYNISSHILNASDFGLPQNRERIYIVAFRKDIKSSDFQFPKKSIKTSLLDILEPNPKDGKIIERDDINIYKEYNETKDLFGLINKPNRPIQIGKVNKGGQGERIYHPLGHAITLSAHGGGVGSKTGLYKIGDTIRKLSPRECARLQGFPEEFIFPESVSEAHKQFGNSVPINVLQYLLNNIIKVLEHYEQETEIRLKNSKTRVQERKRYSIQV